MARILWFLIKEIVRLVLEWIIRMVLGDEN